MVINDIVPPNKRSIRSISLNKNWTEFKPHVSDLPQSNSNSKKNKNHIGKNDSSVLDPILKPTSKPYPVYTDDVGNELLVPKRTVNPQDRLIYDDIHFDTPNESDIRHSRNRFEKMKSPNDLVDDNSDNLIDGGESKGFKQAIWYFIIIIAILGFGVGGLYTYAVIYGGAVLSVNPKTETIDVSGSFDFNKDQYSIIEKKEPLLFEVKASGEKESITKAEGQVILYNEYSKDSQRFVARTRFQASDGRVYRAISAMTVPGYTLNKGLIVPGKVAVNVVADLSGDSQNIDSGVLILPGLQNDPRSQKIYAKVETPIGGAMQGKQKIVLEKDIQEGIKTALENFKNKSSELFSGAYDNEKFALIPSLIFYEVGNAVQTGSNSGSSISSDLAQYSVPVTARAVILSQNRMQEIIKTYSRKKQGVEESISVSDWNNLTALHERKSQSPWIENPQKLRLSGKVDARWYYNSDELKRALLGKSKNDLNNILSQFSGIESAEAIIRPFWKNSFPAREGDIEIVNQINMNQ